MGRAGERLVLERVLSGGGYLSDPWWMRGDGVVEG